MTLDRINDLVKLIPSNAAYISIVTGGNPRRIGDADADLWAIASSDPSFCHSFVWSFHETHKWLPSSVMEEHLWRLFLYKRYRKWHDRTVREVYKLQHPKFRVHRTLIECFLMHSKVQLEWIADTMEIPVEIIKLYHDWFFNVRDRDNAFILSLTYPDSRQDEFRHNYHLNEDWTQIAKRICYNKGILPMLRWLGGRPSESEVTGQESMRALESGIASGGRFAIDCGFQHQPHLAAINGARQLLQSSKIGGQEQHDDDDRIGFGRISSDKSCQAIIKQVTQAAAMEKLRNAQVYDAGIAEQARLALEKHEKDAIPI